MRLFIALWPSAEASARCDALVGALPGARWVPPAQRHLTLRFLGEVDASLLAALEASVTARVRSVLPFALRLRGLGTFGGPRPRVLFAGVAPEEAMTELAARVEAGCVAAGLPPERRPFRPHLTLARLKRVARGSLRPLLEAHAAFETHPFEIDAVDLVRSELSSQGARYETLRRFPLRPA